MKQAKTLAALLLATLAATAAAGSATQNDQQGAPAEWVLDWEDNFDGTEPDPAVWRRTERGHPDWAKTQSKDPRCLAVADGRLVLRGIVNDDLEADPSPYLCGGVISKDLKAFEPGRFEVRARLHGATGAWPAIWLLPADPSATWPEGGEVDIMERLNHDSIAYQTVHSNYTFTLGRTENPRAGVTAPIDPDDFNVYGVDLYPDSVVFHINGVRTNCYPRLADADPATGQFPFYRPMYMLLDMQLGGRWVGEVDPADLPVEMEIDWVRHYLPAPKQQ